MIEVDDSELSEEDREFLEEWAKALAVPVGVLVFRILEAAIDGEQYIKCGRELRIKKVKTTVKIARTKSQGSIKPLTMRNNTTLA